MSRHQHIIDTYPFEKWAMFTHVYREGISEGRRIFGKSEAYGKPITKISDDYYLLNDRIEGESLDYA